MNFKFATQLHSTSKILIWSSINFLRHVYKINGSTKPRETTSTFMLSYSSGWWCLLDFVSRRLWRNGKFMKIKFASKAAFGEISSFLLAYRSSRLLNWLTHIVVNKSQSFAFDAPTTPNNMFKFQFGCFARLFINIM